MSPSQRPTLSPAAARLLAVVVLAAAGLTGTVVALEAHVPSAFAVVLLASGIAAGEGFRIDLPFRKGGNASFTLGDAALAAGLLVLPGVELVAGAALGILAWQIAERVAFVKLVFNAAQYLAGAAAAALIVQAIAPRSLDAGVIVDPATMGALALAMGLFLFVNVATVSGMIAFTSGGSWPRIARQMTPTAGLIATGNAALGLLAVLIAASNPWALPALGVPLVLLYGSSRQEIGAQVDRERSVAFVRVEQRLGEAVTPQDVCEVLAGGVPEILGCQAAVWHAARWATPVPEGSSACPVDADLSVALVTSGSALGPKVDGNSVAIGLGEGVLVAWPGELGITRQSEEWLERLGRSGRASFERAAAHVALRQERATLRAVVDGTGDGIFVTDEAGIIRLWNPAMAKLASIPASGALGQPVEKVLATGPWLADGVHDVVLPDSDHVWRVSVAVLEGGTMFFGGADGIGPLRVAVVHDVTADRRVTRMKDDMMAVVSHELRTPLTPIKASAQLLGQRWEALADTDRRELLRHIEERADHLARLVEDLLLVGQLSHARQNGIPVAPVEVDLVQVVRNEIRRLERSHTQHELTVLAPDELLGRTDPSRLRQILDNLIDNACKFSLPGSPVRIRLRTDAATAVVEVADQGRGIPPEDLERVFERFERAEDPLVMTTGGAGLGLYIVRELCAALGGGVEIDSAPGVGTTVRVRLPLLLTVQPGPAWPSPSVRAQ